MFGWFLGLLFDRLVGWVGVGSVGLVRWFGLVGWVFAYGLIKGFITLLSSHTISTFIISEFKTFISANIDLKDVEDHEAREKEEDLTDDDMGEKPGPSQRLIQPPEEAMDEGIRREMEVPVRVEREPSKPDSVSPTHYMTSRV